VSSKGLLKTRGGLTQYDTCLLMRDASALGADY
jgi:hypothetical protein